MTFRLLAQLIKMVSDTCDTLLKHFGNYKFYFLLNIYMYDKYLRENPIERGNYFGKKSRNSNRLNKLGEKSS